MPAAEPNLLRPALRIAVVTALLLLVPLLAMRFTSELDWSPMDFLVAGGLLFGAGLAFELAMRKATGLAARLAAALMIGATLLLVWANLAVGILGDWDNPANLAYFAVPLVGVAGAIAARARPRGMAFTALAMTLVMALPGVIAAILQPQALQSPPREILLLHGLFVVPYLAAAELYRRAPQR